MLVKICGITNVGDAREALAAGADLIGLNFVAGPRRIDLDRAKRIVAHLDDPSCVVGLVRLPQEADPLAVCGPLRALGIRLIQLYGAVTPPSVQRLTDDGFEPIFVQSVAGRESLDAVNGFLAACGDVPPGYVLLDAHAPGQLGGTGQPADWEAIAGARSAGWFDRWPPLLLAGGLTPDNVAEAVRRLQVAGVDVSSGVEDGPGKKDPAKMRAFVEAARRAASADTR